MKLNTLMMVGFLAVALLSIGVVGFFSFNNAQKSLESAIKENLLNLAEEHALAIDTFLYERRQYLLSVSQADVLEGDDIVAMNRYLEELAIINNFFKKLDFLDLEGNTIAISKKEDETAILTQEEKELFRKAKAGRQGDIFINDVHSVSDGEIIEMDFALPVTDDTNEVVIGILFADIPLGHINEIVQDLNDKTLGAEDSYLINKEGLVLSTGLKDKSKVLKKYQHHNQKHFDHILAGKSGFEVYFDNTVHFEDELVAYTPLPGFKLYKGLGWGLMTVEPAEDAFAPVIKLRNQILLIGLFISILAVLLSFFISRLISKPLSKLSSTVDEVSKGNFKVEIEKTSSIKEINVLAESLDRVMKTMKVSVMKMREKKK